MLTRLIEEIEQISKLKKSRTDRQKLVNVIEVGFIWDILSARYETLETTKVFIGFVKDTDLKLVLQQGEKFINKEIERMENIAKEFGIPTTKKPAVNVISIFDSEVVTDEYIYRHTINGLQSFMFTLVLAFSKSMSQMVRTMFQEFLVEELNIYSALFDYGILKGWIESPPAYRM